MIEIMDQYTKDHVIKKFHSHWVHFMSIYFFAVLCILVGFVWKWQLILVGILIFFIANLIRKATTFYVLDTGVARGYKLLATSRKYIEYENIQNIEVSQSFFQTVLGIGNLKFDTSGSHGIELEFVSVPNPYEIEKMVRIRMSR